MSEIAGHAGEGCRIIGRDRGMGGKLKDKAPKRDKWNPRANRGERKTFARNREEATTNKETNILSFRNKRKGRGRR